MMKYISPVLLVLAIASLAHAVPIGAVKDLTTPVVGTGLPAAGSRVRVTRPEYAGTDVYHALYLPTNWEPGKQYPVIVEYAGNFVASEPVQHPGTVDAMDMGYGISGGEDFIWVSMPFVSEDHQSNALTWWGDVGASVAYTKDTVASIINDYGGNPDALFLSGFSRGAIGVNYIGLADNEIASLWRGFHIHDHYDGQQNWSWTGGTLAQYREEALVRLGRIKGRQQYITSLPSSTSELIDYINTINPTPNVDFILGSIGGGWAHTDEWALYDTPERNAVRYWMQGLAGLEPVIQPLIVNGDFETGDLTGWVNTASAMIDSTTPLAGSHSALLPNDPGPGAPQTLKQSFVAQTATTTVSFTFSLSDPTTRGLQVYLGETGAGQINLQVVDLDNDGDGDVQIYNTNSASFQTVLSDAVSFDTPQTFSLTINSFGASFDYDLSVGSQSTTGLSFWQNSALNDLNELAFVNEFGNTGYEIDNVVVAIAVEGDFDGDGDGDVDGADFLNWQRTDGTPVGLAAWHSNYGFTAPPLSASIAVPEPASIMFLGSLALSGLGRLQRFCHTNG